jgi:chromosome segregation ATPase
VPAPKEVVPVLSRSSELRIPWWSVARLRLPARLATPVLVVSALLFGAGIGSAVFATLWRNETSSRQSVEQTLAQERAAYASLASQIGNLQGKLHTSQRSAAAAARTAADRKSVIASLDQSASSLLAASTPLQDQATSITDKSQSLSALIRTLDNDLASLSRYVSGANSSNLDPAFLQAQLDYLKPSLSKVGAAADSLSSQANRYSDTVSAFVRSASAYAGTARQARKH